MDYLEPVTKWMEWIIGAYATGVSAGSVDEDSGFSAKDADGDYDILAKYIISYLILQNNTEVPPAPYLHPRLNLFQFQSRTIRERNEIVSWKGVLQKCPWDRYMSP